MVAFMKTIKHPIVMALILVAVLYVCYLAYKKFFKKGSKITFPVNTPKDTKPAQLPSCPSCAKPTHLPVCPDCVKPNQLL